MRVLRLASLIATFLVAATPAPARSGGAESVLLSEPLWLLQSQGVHEVVWFEPGPDGIVMVRCRQAASCRHPVVIDEKGLTLVGHSTAALSTGRAGWQVPVFTDRAATALMPAWVVPAASSRTGH